MKIRKSADGGISRAGDAMGANRTPARTTSVKGIEPLEDRIEISSKGSEVRKASSLVQQAPDIRQEMVDELSGQIEKNEYDVDGGQVAPKMIREHMMMHSKGNKLENN